MLISTPAGGLRHVYLGDALTATFDLPQPQPKPYCNVHSVVAEVCGGPHRVVYTDLGYEVLAPTEEPEGTPKEP